MLLLRKYRKKTPHRKIYKGGSLLTIMKQQKAMKIKSYKKKKCLNCGKWIFASNEAQLVWNMQTHERSNECSKYKQMMEDSICKNKNK